jgi:hypothetical protein
MCLKLMLLAEADPSLQYNYGTFVDDSTIEDELCYGTVVSKLSIALIVDGSKHM